MSRFKIKTVWTALVALVLVGVTLPAPANATEASIYTRASRQDEDCRVSDRDQVDPRIFTITTYLHVTIIVTGYKLSHHYWFLPNDGGYSTSRTTRIDPHTLRIQLKLYETAWSDLSVPVRSVRIADGTAHRYVWVPLNHTVRISVANCKYL